MRRLLFAAAVLCAACAGPKPCTMALCPSKVDGAYRVSGWTSSVTVTPGTPAIPIVPFADVDVLSGRVQFVNRRAVVTASEGAQFRFSVSTAAVPVPSILVSSGEVSVALSSTSEPSPVALGEPFLFPVPKK
ncbi:MAG TPA: hypothetical protein VH309_13295 [Elusimicrobiota bacterium]|jgi:hypothetical protein|nr:hypothetical protein [Elusimicrobiota bacterium]